MNFIVTIPVDHLTEKWEARGFTEAELIATIKSGVLGPGATYEAKQ